MNLTDRYSLSSKKEIYYRWGGILLTGILFPIIYGGYQDTRELLIYMAFSAIQCAVFWNGTMFTIWLVRKLFPIDRSIPAAVIAMFGFVGVFVFIVVVSSSYLYTMYKGSGKVFDDQFANNFLISLLVTYFISTVYAATFFFREWKENMAKAEQLEKANLEARFETLKTQVNPHFIFNSLNTLLTLVECNPQAMKYVENLSDYLRYVLQTREKEAVLLREELSMANQYIFLQKSRFGDKIKVSVDVPEKYFHYAVPPLALQMLLENAIKHNVVSKENNLEVRIYIEGNNLVVENQVMLKKDVEVSTGIGLKNIQSRYLILSGKNISITDENGKFKVSLPLLEVPL